MAINNDEKRPPLVATLAEAVVRDGAGSLQRRVPLNHQPAREAFAGAAFDALAAFIEDIEWYGETEVSLARLKRYRDALAALRGDQP